MQLAAYQGRHLGEWWQVQSNSERSLTLNLKDPVAHDIVRQLAQSADVLIKNCRPSRLPVPVLVLVDGSIDDTLAALHGMVGILVALPHRNVARVSQVIDVALYEAVVNCMESVLPACSACGAVGDRAGNGDNIY